MQRVRVQKNGNKGFRPGEQNQYRFGQESNEEILSKEVEAVIVANYRITEHKKQMQEINQRGTRSNEPSTCFPLG